MFEYTKKYIKNKTLNFYGIIMRFLIRYLLFKPVYKFEKIISGGEINPLNPPKIKWLSKLSYRLAKLSLFYGS